MKAPLQRKEDLKAIILPANLTFIESPPIELDLPDVDEIKMRIEFRTRNGYFIEDVYLLRINDQYYVAYTVADEKNRDVPLVYFMDEGFQIDRSKTFLYLTKIWPTEKLSDGSRGRYRRGLFVLE